MAIVKKNLKITCLLMKIEGNGNAYLSGTPKGQNRKKGDAVERRMAVTGETMPAISKINQRQIEVLNKESCLEKSECEVPRTWTRLWFSLMNLFRRWS